MEGSSFHRTMCEGVGWLGTGRRENESIECLEGKKCEPYKELIMEEMEGTRSGEGPETEVADILSEETLRYLSHTSWM